MKTYMDIIEILFDNCAKFQIPSTSGSRVIYELIDLPSYVLEAFRFLLVSVTFDIIIASP